MIPFAIHLILSEAIPVQVGLVSFQVNIINTVHF